MQDIEAVEDILRIKSPAEIPQTASKGAFKRPKSRPGAKKPKPATTASKQKVNQDNRFYWDRVIVPRISIDIYTKETKQKALELISKVEKNDCLRRSIDKDGLKELKEKLKNRKVNNLLALFDSLLLIVVKEQMMTKMSKRKKYLEALMKRNAIGGKKRKRKEESQEPDVIDLKDFVAIKRMKKFRTLCDLILKTFEGDFVKTVSDKSRKSEAFGKGNKFVYLELESLIYSYEMSMKTRSALLEYLNEDFPETLKKMGKNKIAFDFQALEVADAEYLVRLIHEGVFEDLESEENEKNEESFTNDQEDWEEMHENTGGGKPIKLQKKKTQKVKNFKRKI